MSQSPHELFEGENSSLNRTYRQATVRAIKKSMSQSTAQQPVDFRNYLLQAFNDYDVPLSMTTEQVREYINEFYEEFNNEESKNI